MGSHGLAVWHIDVTVLIRKYWRPREAQNWREFRSDGWMKAGTGETHCEVTVTQAADRWDIERIVCSGGDPSDF